MMIAGTDKSIKGISFEVGFMDKMYFSTVFKSFIGTTPTKLGNSVSDRADQ